MSLQSAGSSSDCGGMSMPVAKAHYSEHTHAQNDAHGLQDRALQLCARPCRQDWELAATICSIYMSKQDLLRMQQISGALKLKPGFPLQACAQETWLLAARQGVTDIQGPNKHRDPRRRI